MADVKIKVVQLLPDLDEGGVEIETIELSNFLVSSGHKSIVISNKGRLVSKLKDSDNVHIDWDIGAKSLNTFKHFFPLRKLLLDGKIDILHIRSRVPAWLGFLVWKSIPILKRPILITSFHGFYSVNFYSSVMTKGEKVIAVSSAIKEHIKENYYCDNDGIAVIYGGFDEDFFNPLNVQNERIENLKKRWSINDKKKPIIILPARLTKLKGHLFFLESINLIRNLDFTVLFLGNLVENQAHHESIKNKISSLNLGDKVFFVGNCDDMPSALMIADIVVSSSILPESFGKVAIEAGAMGKPIIATAHGGSLETIIDKKTGWLVEPGNAKKMAEALKEAILHKNLREEYGLTAQKWVKENFTTNKMCKQTLELYLNCLKENSSKSGKVDHSP
jgi:glycosyltransferase involved in cell wall biosynthesis